MRKKNFKQRLKEGEDFIQKNGWGYKVGSGNRQNKGPGWECEAISVEQGTWYDWYDIITRNISKEERSKVTEARS